MVSIELVRQCSDKVIVELVCTTLLNHVVCAITLCILSCSRVLMTIESIHAIKVDITGPILHCADCTTDIVIKLLVCSWLKDTRNA